MKLTKFEKLVLVGCPWLFGVMYSVVAVVIASKKEGIILGSVGVICISLFCVCVLLVKLVEK